MATDKQESSLEKAIVRKKFRSAVRRGTGEAYLLQQKHPDIDFSADIIKASLTNYAYDAQSEGSRAVYVSELIARSKNQDKIRLAILSALETEREDTWALVQLFDLAAVYAGRGDKDARKAIYKRFFRKIIIGGDWVGYDAILSLDGLDGLKYIASKIGKALLKNPDGWQDDHIIRHFQETKPEVNAMDGLQKAGRVDHAIKAYLDNIKRTEEEREDYQQPDYGIDALRTRIADGKRPIHISSHFTKNLSDAETQLLADELLVETNKQRIEKYLSIFSKRKFPYDHAPLLEFAKMKLSDNGRIAGMAVKALKLFSGDDIRKFALEKLSQANAAPAYTELLVSNYRKGDAKPLKAVAEGCKNQDRLHGFALAFIAIYQANKTRECKLPLEALYNKLTCGLCRSNIVKIMSCNGVLSRKLISELAHDSYAENRRVLDRD